MRSELGIRTEKSCTMQDAILTPAESETAPGIQSY